MRQRLNFVYTRRHRYIMPRRDARLWWQHHTPIPICCNHHPRLGSVSVWFV